MKSFILKCVDENAPSSKYPQWGYEVEFRTLDNKITYYAQYPRYTTKSYEFQRNKIYSFEANLKETTGILESNYRKLSHLKNIKLQ